MRLLRQGNKHRLRNFLRHLGIAHLSQSRVVNQSRIPIHQLAEGVF